MLADAFAPPPDLHQDISSLTEVPFVPIGHLPQPQHLAKCVAGPFIPAAPAPFVHPAPPFPPMVPMPPAAAAGPPAMPVIPNGYTVNITNLNREYFSLVWDFFHRILGYPGNQRISQLKPLLLCFLDFKKPVHPCPEILPWAEIFP
ncbi:hypothetical protein ANCCAN_05134 [Ancylostoma caninum]|uniref:Uncharacterized protein n=1 Tax=Ancylostoma caninum TaxID=29170 RepID=A0A368H0T4_ANCCA|nr:hypothetical protein ANCCAN_05134 [Ancylostoma caninum]